MNLFPKKTNHSSSSSKPSSLTLSSVSQQLISHHAPAALRPFQLIALPDKYAKYLFCSTCISLADGHLMHQPSVQLS